MKSVQDYIDRYKGVVKNLGYAGESADILIQLLANASWIGEVENASYMAESSLEKASLINSKIQHCVDMMYSVYRGACPRVIMKIKPTKYLTLNPYDPIIESSNFRIYYLGYYKVIDADHVVDLGLYEEKVCQNGKIKRVKATGLLKQRLIVTFSRKMMEYQRAVRNRQIERARKLLAANDPEEIKKGPNDVKRFMKRIAQTKSGEKATVSFVIDDDKIAEEEKYDGFYAVVTNLNDDAKEVLAISKKRYQIEDCFRIMKTNFSGRPVNHRVPDRIKAHFLICYTALLVYRLLEAKLDDQRTHITTDDLITTMRNMSVVNVHDVQYMALYEGSKALDALTQLSGMVLDHLHYRPKELNQMLKKYLK